MTFSKGVAAVTNPYKDCDGCTAIPFCKMYSGERPAPPQNVCGAKYRLDRAMSLSAIPRMYQTANMYNFKADSDNDVVHKGLSDTIPDIAQKVDGGTNFIYYSRQTGTGKTYAACCLLNHYIYKKCMTGDFDFEHPLSLFVSHVELMDVLWRSIKGNELVDLEPLKTVPLLLLDDLAAGNTTDYTRRQTYLILNARINAGLSTIVTTNLSLDELAQEDALGSRIVSRLVSNGTGIKFGGRDRRRSY